MRRDLPPLNALIAFESAARLGSFTKAASELGVAQPAITRHVANLEAWLDAKLFNRIGNVIHLTRLGEETAELATSVLDRLGLGLSQIVSQRAGDLVIGASFGITHLCIMPRLAAMRAATSATVNFVTSDDYRSFDHGSVDVSIRFGTGEFHGYRAELMLQEECYVVASPVFLERHPSLDPEDLVNTINSDWMIDHGDEFDLGWMTWARWFEHMGSVFSSSSATREVRNYPAMLDMVRHGEGLAIGSVGLEDDLVETGELLRLGPPVSRPGYGYYLVYRANSEKRQAIDGLRELLLTA